MSNKKMKKVKKSVDFDWHIWYSIKSNHELQQKKMIFEN